MESLSRAVGGGLSAQRCGFFFDFDGTLAPIESDPELVRPVPGVIDRLRDLAETAGRVALVSARPVAFLSSCFGGTGGIVYFGLYGLESAVDGANVTTHPAALPYSETMNELADLARAELPAGTAVENKRLTVALHYRAAPAAEPQVAAWAQQKAQELGLVVARGRMVYELKPPGTPDKGSVVAGNCTDLDLVWYFGDDIGDIAAFRALRELQQRQPGFRTTLVAVHNPESGSELEALADITLDSPAEVPAFLDRILAIIKP